MSSSRDTSEFGGLPGAVLEKSSVKGWVQGGLVGASESESLWPPAEEPERGLRSVAFAAAGLYPSLTTRCRPSNSKAGARAKPASPESTRRAGPPQPSPTAPPVCDASGEEPLLPWVQIPGFPTQHDTAAPRGHRFVDPA